jgi:hypothetical protein
VFGIGIKDIALNRFLLNFQRPNGHEGSAIDGLGKSAGEYPMHFFLDASLDALLQQLIFLSSCPLVQVLSHRGEQKEAHFREPLAQSILRTRRVRHHIPGHHSQSPASAVAT